MQHRRGRPKNRRAGCLLCKPWKVNGADGKCAGRRELLTRELEREAARLLKETDSRTN